MVNKLGEHPSRDAEQYLIQVLNVLCPGASGKRRGARLVLEQGKQTAHPRTKRIATEPRSLQF